MEFYLYYDVLVYFYFLLIIKMDKINKYKKLKSFVKKNAMRILSGLRLSISLSQGFYKKIATSDIELDEDLLK